MTTAVPTDCFLASEATFPVQEAEWQEGPAERLGVIFQHFCSTALASRDKLVAA